MIFIIISLLIVGKWLITSFPLMILLWNETYTKRVIELELYIYTYYIGWTTGDVFNHYMCHYIEDEQFLEPLLIAVLCAIKYYNGLLSVVVSVTLFFCHLIYLPQENRRENWWSHIHGEKICTCWIYGAYVKKRDEYFRGYSGISKSTS